MEGTGLYIVQAFTLDGQGGNGAGVAIGDCEALDADARQAIARRLNLSETVFPTSSDLADIRLEYFTPEGEVPLCGHATIAYFTALRELGMLKGDSFAIHTGAGVLKVTIEGDMTFMEQNLPQFAEHIPVCEFEKCFAGFIPHERLIPQKVSTGLWDIMLPVRDVRTLYQMAPDFQAIRDISRRYGCVGIHAFALAKTDSSEGLSAVCRNFAPLYGIDEESATGTSNCALACYLHRNGISLDEYSFAQGFNLGMPSRISVRLKADKKRISEVRVGGQGKVRKFAGKAEQLL